MKIGTRFVGCTANLIEEYLETGPKRQSRIVEHIMNNPKYNDSEASVRWLIQDMAYGYYCCVDIGGPIISTKKGYILNPEYPKRTLIHNTDRAYHTG